MDKLLEHTATTPLSPQTSQNKKDLHHVYGATLFFAIHVVLIAYIHSTFLENFIPAKTVGILFTIGALLGLITLSYTPHLLRILGNRGLMIIFASLEMCCLALMAYTKQPLLIIAIFALHQAIRPALSVSFDVFIERFSSIETIGQSRGIFLSIINSAYVIIPMIMGLLLSWGSFGLVYGLSALLMIPLIVSIFLIKHFEDPHYTDINLVSSFRKSLKHPQIFSIVVVNTILQMFYAIMVIYMPIYLHQYIGFNWGEIGIMFTIMLTPFVLFEIPLGKLSDTVFGEKEILIVGILILALSSAYIPFMESTSIVVWTILLFINRIGASFIEIMADSYFFKNIKNEQVYLLSLWRSLEHISYVIIPTTISALLFIIGTHNLRFAFLIIPFICLFALYKTFKLKDTL